MAKVNITATLLLCVGCCVWPALGSLRKERVRRGDNVTLRCVAEDASGSYTQWLQVCPLQGPRFLRQNEKFHLKRNVRGCYDLQIFDVSEADVCLYFYTLDEKEQKCDYMFQTAQTVLTLADSLSSGPFCPLASEVNQDITVWTGLPWTLLLVTCCLFSALLIFTCRRHLCCCSTALCHREEQVKEAQVQVGVGKLHQCEKTLRGLDCLHTEVTFRLISTEDS